MSSKLLWIIVIGINLISPSIQSQETHTLMDIASNPSKTREKNCQDIIDYFSRHKEKFARLKFQTYLAENHLLLSPGQSNQLVHSMILQLQEDENRVYKHLLGSFSDEIIQKFHDFYLNPSIQLLREDLIKLTLARQDIPQLRSGIEAFKTPISSYPSTHLYIELSKSMTAIATRLNQLETALLERAYVRVFESVTLETLCTYGQCQFYNIPVQTNIEFHRLMHPIPSQQIDQIITYIQTLIGQDEDIEEAELKDFVIHEYGHILWDGTLTEEDWDHLSRHDIPSNEDKYPKEKRLPKFTPEQTINIVIHTLMTIHQHLTLIHPEGVRIFESFRANNPMQSMLFDSFLSGTKFFLAEGNTLWPQIKSAQKIPEQDFQTDRYFSRGSSSDLNLSDLEL